MSQLQTEVIKTSEFRVMFLMNPPCISPANNSTSKSTAAWESSVDLLSCCATYIGVGNQHDVVYDDVHPYLYEKQAERTGTQRSAMVSCRAIHAALVEATPHHHAKNRSRCPNAQPWVTLAL